MAPERGKPALRTDSDSDFESDATTTEAHVETGHADVVDIDADEEEEEEEEVYAGLAAEELRDERLFAGDTIEYYSMAFVFGDPRGYRVAKVLKVANREREYPLRLDSQEMLPNTLMIKRQLTRRGKALEPGAAVWRKIRTFTLHDGEVQGKTRADRLNEGLKNAVTEAFQSLRTESSSHTKTKSSTERTTSNTHDGKRDKGTPSITSFFSKAPAKKGALEAVAAPRPTSSKSAVSSSSSSTSSKSDRRSDSSSLVSKTVSKRSRVELTPSPSPSDHQRRRKDRDGSGTPPSSSASHKHKHDRRPHHSSSSHRSLDRHGHRPLKDKVDVTRFLEHIVEKKSDPRLDLDSYLKLDREEKEIIKEFDSKRKHATSGKDKDKSRPLSSGGGGTSGNSTRMRAGGGRSDASRGGAKGMKSMENYFKPPPRPHPTAKSRIETSPGDAKLNFFLGTENEARPSSASDHARDGKHRSRDAAKSSPKQGLSNTWLSKKR